MNGLILSGGKSTRMGYDKGLTNFHGKPQRDYLVNLLKPYCTDVYFSLSKGPANIADKNIIHDCFELQSPLNGILSAFHYDPATAWLTVPVDMPNIDNAAVKYLLQHRDEKKIATCYFDSEGKHPEPLFTIWEVAAKAFLFDYYNSGGVSPRFFLEKNNAHIIHPPNPAMLVNINTKEDLHAFLKNREKPYKKTTNL